MPVAHAPTPAVAAAAAPPRADLLATARAVAERSAARAAALDHDARPGAGVVPHADFDDLARSGLLAAALPREAGGAGLATDPAALHLLYEVLAHVGQGNLAVGRVFEGHVNAVGLVHEWGTAAQRAACARDVRDGHVFGVWNTEIPASGVLLVPLTGGRVRMDGSKTFCSGAGRVTRAFANGRLQPSGDGGGGGWQMALVPLDRVETSYDPTWWTAEGMRASASGRVGFAGVVLGADALVGGPGDYERQPSFSCGAVRFLAVQLGGARALAAAATAHLRRLGRTDHPVQQARLGEIAAALETGALWLLGAARLLGDPQAPVEDRVAYADLARGAIEGACLDVMRLVDRAVGARGLLPPSPVERIGRDLRLYLRQPNPDGALAAAGAHAAATDRPARGSAPAAACAAPAGGPTQAPAPRPDAAPQSPAVRVALASIPAP